MEARVSVSDPLADLLPDQAPAALQVVALVLAQVSVIESSNTACETLLVKDTVTLGSPSLLPQPLRATTQVVKNSLRVAVLKLNKNSGAFTITPYESDDSTDRYWCNFFVATDCPFIAAATSAFAASSSATSSSFM